MIGVFLTFLNFQNKKMIKIFQIVSFWTKIHYEMFKLKGEEHKVSATESCKKCAFQSLIVYSNAKILQVL